MNPADVPIDSPHLTVQNATQTFERVVQWTLLASSMAAASGLDLERHFEKVPDTSRSDAVTAAYGFWVRSFISSLQYLQLWDLRGTLDPAAPATFSTQARRGAQQAAIDQWRLP